MLFIEFLDFIGRLAVIKFNGTELNNLGLVHKISHVLDDLLAIVNERRVDSLEEEIEESESDDDYWKSMKIGNFIKRRGLLNA